MRGGGLLPLGNLLGGPPRKHGFGFLAHTPEPLAFAPPRQIARIAATTVLCPVGMFAVNEDGGLDKAEEWAPLPDREMGISANWAHRCAWTQT